MSQQQNCSKLIIQHEIKYRFLSITTLFPFLKLILFAFSLPFHSKQFPIISINHIIVPTLVSSQGFTIVTVTTNPKTVNTLSVLTFQTQLTIGTGVFQTGDTLTFSIGGGQFLTSNNVNDCVSQSAGFTVTSCTITANQAIVEIATTVSSRNFQVQLNNYMNPYSATPISGITTLLKNTAGTQRALHQTATLQNLIADALPMATISPLTDIVGAYGVSIRVSITIKNTLKTNGMIKIYFPKWNPIEGDLAFHYFQSDNPTCTNVLNMNPLMLCSYNFANQYLTVLYPVSSDVGIGTQLTFDMDYFLNPYSGIPRTGFTVVTTDNLGGEIDSSVTSNLTITYQVTGWANFDSITLQRVDTQTIVGELSTGQIKFNLDLPIDSGCRMEIKFPADMQITSALSQLTSTGIHEDTLVPPTYFSTATNSFYLDGCPDYLSYIQNTLTMFKMKNKGHVMQTQSFSVYLWAIDPDTGVAYPIAKKESDLIFQQTDFTAGSITAFTVTPVESNEVQDFTRYTLNLWPAHDIPTSSKITIQFPQSINLTEGSCTVQSPLSPMTTSATCQVTSNHIVLTYPFDPAGSFTANSNGLSFIFSSGGYNPLTERDSGSYQVDTFAIDGGVDYFIDTSTFNNVFTPVRGTIGMTVLDITSYETYKSPTSYTLQITPTKKFPELTKLKIQIPPVVTLVGATVPTCSYIIKGQTQISTSMQTVEVSQRPYLQADEQGQSLGTIITPRIVLEIDDAFTDKWYLDPGTPFEIVCDGFRNPRTTRVTTSFKIEVTDRDGYYIEERLSGVTTQMISRPNMPTYDVQISNFTNGAINIYTVTVFSPLPHFTGDIITYEFPLENILPTTVVCIPVVALTGIDCTKLSASKVSGEMTFISDFLDVNQMIQFQILDIQNPPDTRLSSPFTNVMITDPLDYQLTQYIGITTLQTLYFAVVQQKALTQTDYGLLKSSDYIFTYTTINRMPAGCSFLITYPDTVQPAVTLSTCKIDYAGVTYNLYGCAVDLDNSIISISGGFNTGVTAGSEIVITFGPIITPISQLNPGKFTLQAFIGTQYRYFIDEIPEGLIPLFECDHPCRTCNLPSRTSCTSCKTNVPTEILIYLELEQCINRCPDGKYGDLFNDKICTFCEDECLTCSDKLTCTRCKFDSPLTELHLGDCKASCPPELCPINFQCQSCNAPAFQTVTVAANPSTVGQQSTLRLAATIKPSSGMYYGDGDILWLLIPAPGKFIISYDPSEDWRVTKYKDYYSDISLCTSDTLGITVEYCTIYESRVMLKLKTSISNLRQAIFYIQNFQNPQTTTPISAIKTFLTNATESLKSVFHSTYLSNLSPERMSVASLSTSSDVIGASSVTLTATFKILNSFQTDSQIWMLLPYWNPRSSSPKHMIDKTNPVCTGLIGLETTVLTCQYDEINKILKITNSVSSIKGSGTTMSFSVDSFQNPYNGIEKGGFQIQTMESSGVGIVDQSEDLKIQVSTFAVLEFPTLSRADSKQTVGELSSLTFGFRVNLPVDPDCRIRIIFPNDQPVTIDLTSSTGSNLFQSAYGLSALDIGQNYAEIAGCPMYSERTVAYLPNSVTLSKILNIGWVKDTSQFRYQMFAVSNGVNYNIAEISTPDMIVSASMLAQGKIKQLKVEAFLTSAAGLFSTYKLTIQPTHGIPSIHKIKVKFPTSGNDIKLENTPCSVTDTNGVDSGAQCSINTVTNEVILFDTFGAGTYTKDGLPFSFVFSSGGTNPDRTCGTIQFEVSTFSTIAGVDYNIDYFKFYSAIHFPPMFDAFMAQAPLLLASIDSISSLVASYKPSTYNFIITPRILVPIDSYLIIKMPPTIILPIGITQIFCTAVLGVDTYYEYTSPTSLIPLKFKLKKLFAIKEYSDLGTPFTLKCEGIWNPRTLEPTSSLIIQTADENECAIESISDGLTVSMTSLPSFERIQIINDNIFNGQYATYSVDVIPGMLLYEDDVIYLSFPPELTLPANPSCQEGNLLKSIVCTSPSANRLKVEFKFKIPQLTDQYQISFKVLNVRNPPDTKKTVPFQDIEAFDSRGYKIAVYQLVGPTIKNQLPSLAVGTLFQNDNTMSASTFYTITYTTVNRMPSGSSFLIEFPCTVKIPDELTICQVTYNSIDYTMKCKVDQQTGTIKVYQGLTIAIPEGSQIDIKISPVTNPDTPQSISSFKVTSFTDEYQLYLIDKVPNNLVPQYQCQYPCATCPSQADRITCLSCFSTEVEKYLLGTKCVATCPKGTIPNDQYQCVGPTIEFTAQIESISNYQASNQPTKYTIKISPMKAIPDGSTIEIKFPPELSLANGASGLICETITQKSASQQFFNTGKVTTTSSVSPLSVRITGIFLSSTVLDLGTNIIIACDQVQNPPTIAPTASFEVKITHPSAADGEVTTGMSVTMISLPTFMNFKMEPLNRVTGQISDYKVTVSSGQVLNAGAYLLMDFPDALTIPEAVTCSLSSVELQSIACSQLILCAHKTTEPVSNFIRMPQGQVKAVFTFIGSSLAANTPFSFVISGIGNPPSTQPHQVKEVKLKQSDDTNIPELSGIIPTFSMKILAEVSTKSITFDSYLKGEKTGFTLIYETMNRIYPYTFIIINYPLTAAFQIGQDIACSISVNAVPYTHICKLDRLNREIQIQIWSPSGTLTKNTLIPQGAIISITVKEFVNQALSYGISQDTFTLKSYTDKTRAYGIEQISGGLILFSCDSGYYFENAECNQCLEPCTTCSPPGGEICNSCDSTAPQFYEGYCYVKMTCPIN